MPAMLLFVMLFVPLSFVKLLLAVLCYVVLLLRCCLCFVGAVDFCAVINSDIDDHDGLIIAYACVVVVNVHVVLVESSAVINYDVFIIVDAFLLMHSFSDFISTVNVEFGVIMLSSFGQRSKRLQP